MLLNEIAKAVNGKLIDNNGTSLIQGISTDTRTIKKGELFIPLIGERFDGHDFIKEAEKKDIGAVIVSYNWWKNNQTPMAVPTIVVEDTLKALQNLALHHRKKFNIPVVAVTGSNGKTTTKDMIASILGTKLNIVKSKGSFNNEIGLPLTLLEISEKTQAVVVEMGMRGLGQIAELAQIAKPTMGVITNIGPVHLELLGTIENIAKAKGELVETINSGKVFLNGEDYWCKQISQKANSLTFYYGFNDNCDIRAENIQLLSDSSAYKLIIDKQSIDIALPVPGKHNILNSLAAAGVAYELGLDLETIQAGLSAVSLSEKRLNTFEKNQVIYINDTYNANPISMCASIDILARTKGLRKIAVLGNMYELGEYEKEGHFTVGKHIYKNKIDYLITVGDLAAMIGHGALEEGMPKSNVYSFQTNQEAIEFLKGFINKKDAILFKGSRAAKMEDILEAIT